MVLLVFAAGSLREEEIQHRVRVQAQRERQLRAEARRDTDGDGIAGAEDQPFVVAHSYMGQGPTVPKQADLAHTGQVVRIKTKNCTYFLECDCNDTPTVLIKRLAAQGHVSPTMYKDVEEFTRIPKKKEQGYLARIQRGPIPLDDNVPIKDQQVGPEEILCYVEVTSINRDNINDQTFAEPDESIRQTPWYEELERLAAEEKIRRLAEQEERERREEARKAKEAADEAAKAAKKGGKKKKKK
jgi:hypothetical protein